MRATGHKVVLHTSPHLRETPSVDVIMRNVVYALLPITAFSIYQFGLSVLALVLVCVGTCITVEHLVCRWSHRQTTVNDWSVTITGMLLALTLPPGFPLWMAAVSAIAGVGIGKMFFGGLGYNIMNPALIGRAFAQAAFTAPMTAWVPILAPDRFTSFIPSTLTLPFLRPESIQPWLEAVAPDGFSGATPLALMKFEQIPTDSMQLLLGSTAGSAGETSALLIMLCGAYLVYRRMMEVRVTLSILIVAALTTTIFYLIDGDKYPGPLFMLCSGGLMLGAVFMATDMVASPVTPLGVWVYGGLIGFVTIIIRLFGGLSEGIMYAILLANAFSPLISSITQPRRYGAPKKKGVG